MSTVSWQTSASPNLKALALLLVVTESPYRTKNFMAPSAFSATTKEDLCARIRYANELKKSGMAPKSANVAADPSHNRDIDTNIAMVKTSDCSAIELFKHVEMIDGESADSAAY